MSGSDARTQSPTRGLSAAGIVVGALGCVIITASSVYTALKMGALPWPSVFTSIMSLVVLRALGRRSLVEANVTQIIMSAGSMVAGGLAFTIPAIWMLGHAEAISLPQMLLCALSGTFLGLAWTALMRHRLVEDSGLEYPIGVACAETLKASEAKGATGVKLAVSMGVAAVYALVRDVLGLIPTLLFALPIPGVSFALYNSPMMLSVGFLVGGSAIAFWLAGALVANFGIICGGTALGLFDVEFASALVSSLGMGLMMGSGLGVVARDVVPEAVRLVRDRGKASTASPATHPGLLALLVATAALLCCFALGLGPLPSVVVVALSFVTTIMSAQSVGQTGIDPMEIFGLIVLVAVAAMGVSDQVRLIFVAAVVAIACGLGGDVMSDFKCGQILGGDPRQMWVGQAIGSIIGAVVSVVVMAGMATAFGTDAFGPGKEFVSAQASVVATAISGIPNLPAFIVGIVGGIVLYCLGLPAMMVGLGVYLPLYLSLTAPIGAIAKYVWDRRGGAEEDGIVMASGLLGGESIVGVVVALFSVAMGLIG